MVDPRKVRDAFMTLYPGSTPRLFAAPGRVNLIGEHTDYNDGFVLPVAIDRNTIAAASPREDRIIQARSASEEGTIRIDLDAGRGAAAESWGNYIEGVARVLESRGARLRGADLLVESDVPLGAGLSSSAALEVAVGMALMAIAEERTNEVMIALAGQEAEHTYVGTKCGIMDQLTAAKGKRGHALLIDCRTLGIKPIPVDTSGTALVVCNTGVKHSLASSAYNQRREECEEGVRILQQVMPDITALRDVSPEELEQFGDLLPEVIRRRCRHVVTENARTLMAAEALEEGNLPMMGELMAASHISLRDDYEVSCRELDLMVEIAGKVDGAIGARMTGGGFGGCTVNLVRRDALEEFQVRIMEEYRKGTGIEAEIYISEIGDGVREIG